MTSFIKKLFRKENELNKKQEIDKERIQGLKKEEERIQGLKKEEERIQGLKKEEELKTYVMPYYIQLLKKEEDFKKTIINDLSKELNIYAPLKLNTEKLYKDRIDNLKNKEEQDEILKKLHIDLINDRDDYNRIVIKDFLETLNINQIYNLFIKHYTDYLKSKSSNDKYLFIRIIYKYNELSKIFLDELLNKIIENIQEIKKIKEIQENIYVLNINKDNINYNYYDKDRDKNILFYSIKYFDITNIIGISFGIDKIKNLNKINIIGISFGSDEIKKIYTDYFKSDINNFKKLLILFKTYIDYNIEKSKTGGSLNKSYQLYMDDNNKYFIIYNKKNVYLNKKNTYKKGKCLYMKINKNLEVKLKN